MPTLSRELRKELERAVIAARRVGEAGARNVLEGLAVHHHEPWGSLTPDQRQLRNRLRAHGRQLGDRRDTKRGTQTMDHLVGECAYEHWHRMLFARFLAECNLLIEPETGVSISLDECQELARERGVDWLELASSFAERMLPQIFRSGDPVLEVTLPPESRQELEELLKSLPARVFRADDSLGWVYQFWQSKRKDEVNASGDKIGADELPAVTELFTEDYMVLFLLHNTLGAWWVGKVLARQPELAKSAASEEQLRAACAVNGYEWSYLRFVREGEGPWRPAAGTFERWPSAAKDIKVLDPCMGSGHFLVFALPILVGFRMEEEGLSREQAVGAVLQHNLFGLEIDPRCTQIAAFNLALTAWKTVGYRVLPPLNLACSGLGINAKEEDWVKLAGKDARLRDSMKQLYELFRQAPILGSLIDPKQTAGDLFAAQFAEVQPLLEQALASEQDDETTTELAVTAKGLVQAAQILADEFTLVATNVPYLGRGKQDEVLKIYCDLHHPHASSDLATCFVERCLAFCRAGTSATLVTPQNWLFLGTYKALRRELVAESTLDFIVELGPGSFQTPLYDFSFVLSSWTNRVPVDAHSYLALVAEDVRDIKLKALSLRDKSFEYIDLQSIKGSADRRILTRRLTAGVPLSKSCKVYCGLQTGDNFRFVRLFWEVRPHERDWEFFQRTARETRFYDGLEQVLLWQEGKGALRCEPGFRDNGSSALRTAFDEAGIGFVVHRMGNLPVSLLVGHLVDQNGAVLIPSNPADSRAVWAYLESTEYFENVRKLDNKVGVTPATLAKVPLDITRWQRVGSQKYPQGLPKPDSGDPTQWLFSGHPKGTQKPLQVAVARLLGYRWSRQTGSSFSNCPALGPDGLESHADADGIVCLTSLKGEDSAADRLRRLLADASGEEWSAAKQAELLSQVGYSGRSLEDWLRDGFFEEHCALFHQRPFVWHIWDGLRDGFHALVSYHKLAGPNREGRRTLEKLIFSYLGDWIDRQRADQKAGVEGADAKVAAAEHVRAELNKILEGERPYDLFVRWKPIHEQPIGWEPDINDGVRINIRPFMTTRTLNARSKNACILRVTPKIKWKKDRGKQPERPPEEYPWFWAWDEKSEDFAGGKKFDGNRWNDLHYTRSFRRAARERHAAKEEEQG